MGPGLRRTGQYKVNAFIRARQLQQQAVSAEAQAEKNHMEALP
jgi:hypothetical protein